MCDIVTSLAASRSKKAQIQYTPFEAVSLGILCFLMKEDYNTCGAQKITIYNNAKNMGTFMQRDMNNEQHKEPKIVQNAGENNDVQL